MTANTRQHGCITRVISSATSYCTQTNDAACQCAHVEWGYGLRDCGIEACGNEQAQQVISYGVSYCESGSPLRLICQCEN
ncbi:MAG: CFEM domain-containing protein [Terriglobus roseus]|nr:CFEM domain-containing protein [Terriglobus roseus]